MIPLPAIALWLAVGLQTPLLIQNSPENLGAMTHEELTAYLSDCVAMGVGAVTTMPTSLRAPYGDAPNAASELSLWRVPADPSSGIDPVKVARWEAHCDAIDRWGLWRHVPVLEIESAALFPRPPQQDPALAAYLKAVVGGLRGRRAILDFEECPKDATWVALLLAYLREVAPNCLTALHNPTGSGPRGNYEEDLFGSQVNNPNLDCLMLQVGDPWRAADRVAYWKGRLAAAGHDALVIVAEPGPAGVGIAPDALRDPRMTDWWVRFPKHSGADGFGIYFGDSDQTARSVDLLRRSGFYISAGDYLWPKTKPRPEVLP